MPPLLPRVRPKSDDKAAVAQQFGPGYGYIEAQLLHTVIRSYKPKRIIEVGSGVSTRCTLVALEMNAREDGEVGHITSIEPYPSAALRSLTANSPYLELEAQPIQAVSLDMFQDLSASDVLFVDSSHVVRAGGDVNRLILEVLPRLAPGVPIHLHDIYFPYYYQRDLLQMFTHQTRPRYCTPSSPSIRCSQSCSRSATCIMSAQPPFKRSSPNIAANPIAEACATGSLIPAITSRHRRGSCRIDLSRARQKYGSHRRGSR